MVKYSWILPVRNEAQSLPQLISEISRAMKGKDFEIIAVNDASTDSSLTTLTSLTRQTPQLKLISFKLNQGKWTALRAGFTQAQGSIIITLDSDLQDDPSQLPKLLVFLSSRAKSRDLPLKDYALISGARINRFDPLYKVFISNLGNKLVSFITGKTYLDLNSSFKVYRKEILDQIPKQGSMFRFSLLFAKQLGYQIIEVPITHRPRLYGKSKFGIVKYLRIIYDLVLILLLFTGSGRIRRNGK